MRRLFEGKPKSVLHLDAHGGRDVAQASGAVHEQVEADDLEDFGAISPVADVDVLDVGQLGDHVGANSGFLANFAQGGLFGLLTWVDGTLWQGDEFGVGGGTLHVPDFDVLAGAVHVGLNDGDIPTAAHLPNYNAASGGFSHHGRNRREPVSFAESATADNREYLR